MRTARVPPELRRYLSPTELSGWMPGIDYRASDRERVVREPEPERNPEPPESLDQQGDEDGGGA